MRRVGVRLSAGAATGRGWRSRVPRRACVLPLFYAYVVLRSVVLGGQRECNRCCLGQRTRRAMAVRARSSERRMCMVACKSCSCWAPLGRLAFAWQRGPFEHAVRTRTAHQPWALTRAAVACGLWELFGNCLRSPESTCLQEPKPSLSGNSVGHGPLLLAAEVRSSRSGRDQPLDACKWFSLALCLRSLLCAGRAGRQCRQ